MRLENGAPPPWPWHEWRGTDDGVVVMLIRRLVRIPLWYSFRARKWRTLRVDLHKFVGADKAECFHTHPAHAWRIPFKGGYREECVVIATTCCQYAPVEMVPVCGLCRTYCGEKPHRFELHRYTEDWTPGRIGHVKPQLAHRVDRLLNGISSWSLWIRGPICADVELIGDGWPANQRAQVVMDPSHDELLRATSPGLL
jgi:hypothetical protein